MRALVLSDVHSNAEALRAVLARVRRKRFDRVVCLGDFVGYGAEPNQVLDVMRTFRTRKLYVRGNHDRVASGIDDGRGFNDQAKEAAIWTRQHLSPLNRRFLRDLPCGPRSEKDVLLCHGSPEDEDEYVFNAAQAARVFSDYHSRLILYGHTHLPVLFSIDEVGTVRAIVVHSDKTVRLDRNRRYLINPGSVGQPRDRNPAASFAIVDSDRSSVQFFRVAYDVAKTQESIIAAGLPRIFADRLRIGA